MILESIKFCLQNNIGHLAVGNTSIQANKAHSFPCNVKRFADLMKEYNIYYTNDIFNIESREKEDVLLKNFNIDVGRKIGLSSVTNQPRCLLGVYSTLWLMGNPLSEKDMAQYFDDKLSLMREYLFEYAHLKEGSQGEKEFETKVDESISGGWEHEFGPIIDKMLSKILSPLWELSKIYFRHKRESNCKNERCSLIK